MTIQQLQIFQTLSRHLNYTTAAQELYMTRQAVRQNISALEHEFGITLVKNNRNQLALTAAGTLLAQKSISVLDAFEQLRCDILAEAQSKAPIRLGISSSVLPSFLPGLSHILEDFVKDYPNLKIIRCIEPNDIICDLVSTGELDLGIVLDLETVRNSLTRTMLTAHPAAITMCKGHPLWGRKKLSLKDFANETIFLPGCGPEFAPLSDRFSEQDIPVDIQVMEDFYKVYYFLREEKKLCLNRLIQKEQNNPYFDRIYPIPSMPSFCSSIIVSANEEKSAGAQLIQNYLLRADTRQNLLIKY